MSLTPTNRHTPCQICDDTSGKCRWSREDLTYWQCMTYADTRKGETINGFKCIGLSKNNQWAQFKPDNSQEWTEQQKLEWQRENQRRRQEKTKGDEQRRQQSLSAVERHEQYTQMLSELSLHPDDRADLVRRGFSDSQIELSGFKSIKRYHQLKAQYSELLPGTSRGNRLIIRDEGYLCPIRNTEGLIVACQVRIRTIPTTETNRYRWLSGYGQTLHLFPEECKPEGELPLAVFKPAKKPEGMALVEGTGAKPFLVSQRLNLFTIGAAGGQWASSPELLKQYLQEGKKASETSSLLIFPDAGDVANRSVMTRWQKVAELVKGLGYEVKFGWWNQVSKSDRDIDELKDYSAIQFINPDEFFGMGQTPVTSQGFSTFDDTPEWKRKAHANWRKNRQFTNAIKSIDQWCNWSKPEANTIFFGKAGLGRGKTTLLKKWVKDWKESNTGFLCLGYRNTLLLQLCEQLGAYHLHDKEASLMRMNSSAGIALCVDSLWRFSPEDFDNKIIILDELKSVIKHLLHSSTVRNRDKILNLFHEAIKRCKQVICLDGLMDDWCVDYLHTICPEKQIIKAENTYQGKKPLVNFLLGTVVEEDENGKIKVNDRSPWLKHLMENSAIPAVCADSQIFIEALDNIFSAKGLKVLRIDSKTVSENYVKEFLRNCNAYIKEHRPDILLYTPSAESGVDVSIPNYFTEHFAFFFGVIDIDGMLQMLGRIRDNITKYVWCKNFVSIDEKQASKSPFINTIQKSLNQLLISDISTSITDPESWNKEIIKHLTAIVENSNNIDTRISTLIQSIQNFEKSNLRECLKEALLDSGYTVKDCVLESSNHGGKAKEETEAVKRRNASDIFKAEKIPLEAIKELGFDSNWEDRCKVMQARLRERLPDIDESPIWSEDFIYRTKYKEREFISQQEMFWLFNNPDVAKQQSQKQFHWMAKRLNTFIGTYKSRWAKIHALHQIGLPEFLDSAEEWTDDNPELVALLERAKHHSTTLGCHQGKLSNIQFLGRLLAIIGLKLKSRKVGENLRCYHIDRGTLNDPVRVQVLTCIEQKFTQTPDQELTQNDWENAINESHGILPTDTPQTQSGQSVQAQTPDPNFVYRNQGSGVCKNEQEKASEKLEDLINSNAAISTLEVSNIEQLVEAFEFCDSIEVFKSVIEGEANEAVRDAIALSASQPKRLELQKWFDELFQPVLIQGSKIRIREDLPSDRLSLLRGAEATIQAISGLGRLIVEAFGRVEYFHPSEVEILLN